MTDEANILRASLRHSPDLIRVIFSSGDEVQCTSLFDAIDYAKSHGAQEIIGRRGAVYRPNSDGKWAMVLEGNNE